jgi:hypothetical protein
LLGDFGPRAEKAYIPIRDWGVRAGTADVAKAAMNKIKSK